MRFLTFPKILGCLKIPRLCRAPCPTRRRTGRRRWSRLVSWRRRGQSLASQTSPACTTSTFTPDAVAFAGANGIKLHDGEGLLSLIASRTQEQQQDLLEVALEGDYGRPTCGIKLVRREPMAGGKPFWGRTNFPRCRTKMQLRAVWVSCRLLGTRGSNQTP